MNAANVDPASPFVSSRRSLRHPLLQLMPYPSTAPKHLLQLQEDLTKALDGRASTRARTGAAMELAWSVTAQGSAIPDGTGLIAEAMRLVADSLPRPVLYEQLALAHLACDGIRVAEDDTAKGCVALPRLVRDQATPGSPTAVASSPQFRKAFDVWSSAVRSLLAASDDDVALLDADDLRAAIRTLILYMLHMESPALKSAVAARLEFFETRGISLWNIMSARLLSIDASYPDFHDEYGEHAQRAVWHHLRGEVDVQRLASRQCPMDEPGDRQPPLASVGSHVVIAGSIPKASTEDDQVTLRRYASLQQPLPVAPLPDIDRIENIVAVLTQEFPWADRAIQHLADELTARRLFGAVELGLSPTLLVGMPGSGKSRLVRRMAEELQVPFCPLALAGMNDSMTLVGTARGWATGQPSPLIEQMVQHHSASTLVLLDEIDKVGATATRSAPPTVALLNLLEPENSRRWYDTFLQTPCDLSRLMFWATANSLQPISKPLLSRFRIVLVPEPQREHFHSIARGALHDIAAEWGLPEGTLSEIGSQMPVGTARNAREVRSLARAYLTDWARRRLGPHRLH